jgi:GrpB-like predicted nucleotidyltransferase (UPF0157 family)
MVAIEIVDYRSSWPEEFRQVGASLRASLGPSALRINHIGSTSVTGLSAKDVIDVQVSVASLDLDQPARQGFETAGYPLYDDVWTDHLPAGASLDAGAWTKRMARPVTDKRRTNVHVRVAGSPNERYALLFRDYLRAHPPAAATYGEIKRELASRHADDMDAYYTVKDPVCDLIMDAAEPWAVQSAWVLPVADA